MVTKRQKEILIGTILGDGYLQKTGKRNARLKLEHSERQRDYLWWKYEELKNLMQDKPKRIERYNPVWKRTYVYYRCQTHSMPILGRLKRRFYDEQGRKAHPRKHRSTAQIATFPCRLVRVNTPRSPEDKWG
jgi:hypothetical protein